MQLAAGHRELIYDWRFASTLVYTGAPDQPFEKPSFAAVADSLGVIGPRIMQSKTSVTQSKTPRKSAQEVIPLDLCDPKLSSRSKRRA